jgi:hypothetical protein
MHAVVLADSSGRKADSVGSTDLIENRPTLSCWHAEWRDAFAQIMQR